MSRSSYKGDPYWITAKFASQCHGCDAQIAKGESVFYYPKGKFVYGGLCGCAEKHSADFNSAVEDEDFYNRGLEGVDTDY